jgi:hypothetical protein
MIEVARVWLIVLYWWDGSLHVSETSFSSTIKCHEVGMTVQEHAAKIGSQVRIANWSCETRKGNMR